MIESSWAPGDDAIAEARISGAAADTFGGIIESGYPEAIGLVAINTTRAKRKMSQQDNCYPPGSAPLVLSMECSLISGIHVLSCVSL